MSSVRDFPAPAAPKFLEAARAWLADPTPGPPVRGAATVLLLRDAARGPEVFMMRRVASMAFAPSMFVFPGGGVDAGDDQWEMAGEVLAQLVERMALGSEEARGFVGCAVREVEEEVGVRLDPAALSVRAHWVTPPFESRRYDTWFFAARTPADQVARGRTSESDHSRWVRAEELLGEHATGSVVMLPPTIVMLEELAACADVEAYLGARPAIGTVMPELVQTPDGIVLRAHLP